MVLMFLVRLIYCSMQTGIGDADIEAILDRSRANNALDGICAAAGFLGHEIDHNIVLQGEQSYD